MDDPKDPKDPQDPKTPPNPDPKDPKEGDDEVMKIPKSKWDQNYARMKKAEDDAEALRKEKQEREEAEARAKGEHEKLANDYKAKLDTTSAEAEKLRKEREEDEKTFQTILDGQLAQISDENKALIPEEFTTRQKLAYIEKNRERLLGKGAKPAEPGQPNGNGKTPSDEQATLQTEFDALKEKARKNGGNLFGTDKARYLDLNRKLSEMKAAKK